MARHNDFGKWGEEVAAEYLVRHGFELLARNWRHQEKEVDIIAQKDGGLYFVEVKTRHGEGWRGEDAITSKKCVFMKRAMIAWKLQHPSPMPVYYPAIIIVVRSPLEPPEIRWYDNIWEMRLLD